MIAHVLINMDYGQDASTLVIEPSPLENYTPISTFAAPMEMERRSWFATRILNVAKLLSPLSLHRVNELLLGFLDISSDSAHTGYVDTNWMDELREETLGTAHIC
jgi:hypothetical protein